LSKILILYITTLSGHYKAAKAIEEALRIKIKDSQIISLDILNYLHPRASKLINFLYSLIIKKLPFIWGSLYDKRRFIKGIEPVKRLLYFYEFRKIKSLITELNPQVIVCTQAFPCGLVAFFKNKTHKNIPLIGAVTDFWPNRFWFSPKVDYYVIGLDWAKERFKELGIEEEKIKILGLPIMPRFIENFDRDSLSLEFNLSKTLPAVLLMGGGSGIGPLGEIASFLDNSNLEFQLIVVCGRNKKLYRWFLNKKFKKPIRIFSYTEAIPKLMSFSDIIITKPGGITIAESLAKGLAIIVFKPIPGQEENNLRFLLKKNLVFKIDRAEDILPIIESLLSDKERLRTIQEKCRAFSTPDSSLKIADLILENIK